MIPFISRPARLSFRLTRPPQAMVLGRRQLTTLGIRKEDPARVWERRAPLTPEAVENLIKARNELQVEVESCSRRCFPDGAYKKAGASIVPALSSSVDLVLGIKEPPVQRVHELLEQEPRKRRKWMVFSHTHKGQSYNVPLLSAFMDDHHSQTLIDYELLTVPSGDDGGLKRVAAFGWYAGAVGAGEALCMTGLALLKRGVSTPLLQLPRPYTFASLDEYKKALRTCGQAFSSWGSDQVGRDGPVVIGVTGRGNVSTGAKDMLDAMGVEWVKPEALEGLEDVSKVYACMILPSSYLRSASGSYDRAAYYADPPSYSSSFSTTIAPYLTCLINGAGWQPGYPRTMTNGDLDGLIQKSGGQAKLVAVQDVACDLKGGLEFLDRHTTIDEPHWEGPGGILISSTDILPTELPADASKHFSSRILPYIQQIVHKRHDQALDDTLDRATIVKDGEIQGKHAWLLPAVQEWRQESGSTASTVPIGGNQTKASQQGEAKRILLLGSGLVAGPAVDVFAARSDVQLLIGSNNLQEAQGLSAKRRNVEAFELDVSDASALSEAVSKSDVVVSLLPAPMHVGVAKHCLEHGKHLVTASYVSPEMKALDAEAKSRDVLLLGECGLDPGIDSMAAMRILDRVKRENKRVTSFVSWCGGLPEPSACNVPLGYKFSWSPRAVLTAAGNDAQFKLSGEVRSVPGSQLLEQHFPDVKLWEGLELEGLANRDSLPYAEKYGLGKVEDLKDLFRGTLRYKGFSTLLNSFRKLGLLSDAKLSVSITSPSDLLVALLDPKTSKDSALVRKDENELMSLVKAQMETKGEAEKTVEALRCGSTDIAPLSLPPTLQTPLDILAFVLSKRLAYAPGERDSCLLHHSFKLVDADSPSDSTSTAKEQTVTASLLHYGTPQASSMSITVGKTLALAALRVADGHVKGRGVTGPYEREVWEGVLDALEGEGVRVEENWDVD